MSQAYGVRYTAAAARALRKLDRVPRDRVSRTIEILRVVPRPPLATKLVGKKDLWRVRTGDYRIVYRVEDELLVIVVVTLGHRSNVYR